MEGSDFSVEESCLEETFHRATEFVTDNASVMQQDDLLHLYGRYKQSICGPCNEPMPGILKFRSRSKWTSWHNLGNMSKEEAMKQYIDRVTTVSSDWDSGHKKETNKKSRFGPVTSSHLKTEPDIKEELKTAFDFVKEGNINQIRNLLSTNAALKNSVDENGLSLLHWACDRGHVDVADYLVSLKINVNCQDKDGQTPLHYASSCGHGAVVKLLLKNDASVEIYDTDGLSPADVAYNTSIKDLLLIKHL